MSRFKNYGTWVSLISAILLAVQAIGVLVGFTLEDSKINAIMVAVNMILGVLVALGILSNPTTENKGYGDDK